MAIMPTELSCDKTLISDNNNRKRSKCLSK